MPILYSVVTRGTNVLAKYASCPGNFAEVSEQILAKMSPDHPTKLTYSHGNFLFHYIKENGIIYMCITDFEFPREKAFAYLREIKQRFQSTYGTQAQIALPYAMNSDFSKVLSTQMKFHNESNPTKLDKVQDEVDQLKDIMVKNIESMVSRGEKLDHLITKTEDLETSSIHFQRSSRNLKRALLFKNIKLTLFFVLLTIAVIYIIVSISCGGVTWPNCV